MKLFKQAVFAGLALTIGMSASVAQISIEEVVVTAQRREQNLQDVPISINAFSSESIQKFMFNDVGDYIIRTPNASFTTDGSKSRRRLSIRGVTDFLAINNTLKPSTFGFYVDDFSVADSTSNPPVLDVERIEILRGPQATYFGKNALGGGINITSNKPKDYVEGSIMFDYSNFDTKDVEAMINLPVISEQLAIRANVKWSESDGNIKNINAIGGGNESEYKYGKIAARWTPMDNLTVDVTASILDEDVGMREGVPTGVFSTFAGATLFAGEFPDTDGDGNSNPTPDGVGFYPNNRNRVNFNSPQNVGAAFRNIVGKVDYELNDILFTSITGFISSDFNLAGDIDGSSINAFTEFRNIERTSFSQEVRIQNTGDSRLQWNIGAIYSENDGEIWNRTFAEDENRFTGTRFLIDSQNDTASADSWAIFGELGYQLTEKIRVAAGGRYSEETIDANISGFSGGFVQVLTSEDTFTDFSPRFTANYDFNDKITFYTTISKGFKSGGVQISPLPSRESYRPEEMWNYEIGMKGDFLDDRLRMNLAVFYMDWTDLQTNFQESGIDGDGNFILFGGTDNAESATSQGVELTATALVSENIVANLNVGYLNASFDKFTAFIDGANRNLDSAGIPLSPKWTISADAEYRRPLWDKYEGFARLEYSYRHGTKTLIAGLIQTGFPWQVPSYDFFNLRVGFETDDYTITGYAENLFDENYYTNAYQKAFAGGLFAEPSFRSYGVRLNYRFDKQ